MLTREQAAELLKSNVEALGVIADGNASDDVRVRALSAQQRGLALAAQWAEGSEVESDEADEILDELAARRVAGK